MQGGRGRGSRGRPPAMQGEHVMLTAGARKRVHREKRVRTNSVSDHRHVEDVKSCPRFGRRGAILVWAYAIDREVGTSRPVDFACGSGESVGAQHGEADRWLRRCESAALARSSGSAPCCHPQLARLVIFGCQRDVQLVAVATWHCVAEVMLHKRLKLPALTLAQQRRLPCLLTIQHFWLCVRPNPQRGCGRPMRHRLHLHLHRRW